MAMSLEKMLPILQCPRDRISLIFNGLEIISSAGKAYPLVNGTPILVNNVLPMHVTPPETRTISQNSSEFVLGREFDGKDVVVLNLGSGNVPSFDPRVISLDVLPNDNVDIVGEAENLPFADNSIDHIHCDAVFEHVYDPMKAISEVRRVLKSGGTFHIDTAFMQGYHGFPGHYFNMTPQAVETFLIDDFILERSGPPFQAGAFHLMFHGMNFLLENIPETSREQFLDLPLRQVLAQMQGSQIPDAFSGRVSEYMLRSLGPSTAVIARKPENYEQVCSQISNKMGLDEWSALKRGYYASRMSVIMEHHGVNYWKMRAVEDLNASPYLVEYDEVNLIDILNSCGISNTMDVEEWNDAIKRLDSTVENLRSVRDKWITEFLTRKNAIEMA